MYAVVINYTHMHSLTSSTTVHLTLLSPFSISFFTTSVFASLPPLPTYSVFPCSLPTSCHLSSLVSLSLHLCVSPLTTAPSLALFSITHFHLFSSLLFSITCALPLHSPTPPHLLPSYLCLSFSSVPWKHLQPLSFFLLNNTCTHAIRAIYSQGSGVPRSL